jgi:hypothetical protein
MSIRAHVIEVIHGGRRIRRFERTGRIPLRD